MDKWNLVNFDASDKLIIGKPATGIPAELSTRIEKSLRGYGLVRAAFLPQYFALGKMPAPRMMLVLVASEAGKTEELAARANEMQAAGEWGDKLMDICVMDMSDPLLAAVRRAKCELNLS